MDSLYLQTCSSVLRLKEGEYRAMPELAQDVASRFLPHFVLPPPGEMDPEQRRVLQPIEVAVEGGNRVGRYWRLRPCLLDPRFLVPVFGNEEESVWLTQLFKTAASKGAKAVPALSLAEIEGPFIRDIRGAIGYSDGNIAIRLELKDFEDFSELRNRLHRQLLRIGIKPASVIIVIDFSRADLDIPEYIGESIVSYHSQLLEIGLWQKIIVEFTSYPSSNPAKAGGEILLPRNEWKAWEHAVLLDKSILETMLFGDFGPDSSEFSFPGKKKIRAIRHYRYSTKENWFVVRAIKAETDTVAMRVLAQKIVTSKHFAGRMFSAADNRLFQTANQSAGPGNASTWRQINVGHHLTRIVTDLGHMHNYEIKRLKFSEYIQEKLPI